MNDKETEEKFGELLDVMARLRSETGCPWDREQTHLSLKPCLLEETYELTRRLGRRRSKKAKRRIGRCTCCKSFFTRRSPRRNAASRLKMLLLNSRTSSSAAIPTYLPANRSLKTTASVLKQRLQIKASEKKAGESKSALGNVPKAMPALARAQSITRRAAHLGFDWPDIGPVWGKVEEEMRELKNCRRVRRQSAHRRRAGRSAFFARQSRALPRASKPKRCLAQTIDRFTRALSLHRNQTAASEQEFRSIVARRNGSILGRSEKIEAREKSPA